MPAMGRTLITVSALIFIAFALLLVTFITGPSARAEELTVDDSGGAAFNTIQNAIDAADEGDTIRVYEGTYHENVMVNKTVDLVGNGSATAIIDGTGVNSTVEITADGVKMSGFRVTGSGDAKEDAGIKILADNVAVSDNNCTGNYYGIFVNQSEHVSLVNNSCYDNARNGILILYSTNCLVQENDCKSNGNSGIYLTSSDNNDINDNYCSDNDDYGIVLFFSEYNILERNTCNYGVVYDGLWLYRSNGNIIINSIFNFNRIGIRLVESNLNSIYNASCYANNNYGIYLDGSSDNRLTYSTCTDSDYGLALFYLSHRNEVSYNTFSDNQDRGIFIGQCDENEVNANLISGNRQGINVNGTSRDNVFVMNNIFENSDYGLYALDIDEGKVEASYNWWGNRTGPHNPTTNIHGSGDMASDEVEFEPWLELSTNKNTQPLAVIVSIDPESILENKPITFRAKSVSWYETVTYVWRSSIDGEFYSGVESDISYDGLSHGTHTIYLRVMDEKGTWSVEASSNLSINMKPLAVIAKIDPSPAYLSSAVRLYSGAVDDGDVAIYSWTSSIDGELYNGTNFYFTEREFSLGEHTIYHEVMDDKGVWSATVTTVLNVIEETGTVNERPTVTISSPASGIDLSGLVNISGTAADPEGSLEGVEFSIDGNVWITVNGTSNWYHLWYTVAVDNGDYLVRVKAYDGEKYSNVTDREFKVKNTVVKPAADDDENEWSNEDYMAAFSAIGVMAVVLIIVGVVLVKLVRADRKKPARKALAMPMPLPQEAVDGDGIPVSAVQRDSGESPEDLIDKIPAIPLISMKLPTMEPAEGEPVLSLEGEPEKPVEKEPEVPAAPAWLASFPAFSFCPGCGDTVKVPRPGRFRCRSCSGIYRMKEDKEIVEDEAAAPSRPGEAFPFIGHCPGCSKSIKIPRPGRFRCKACKDIYRIGKDGMITGAGSESGESNESGESSQS